MPRGGKEIIPVLRQSPFSAGRLKRRQSLVLCVNERCSMQIIYLTLRIDAKPVDNLTGSQIQ